MLIYIYIYISIFKKGNVTNFNDINEVFNTNLGHTPKTYIVPTAEKIKKSKQPKTYDYMYLVPSTFKKVFFKNNFKFYFL